MHSALPGIPNRSMPPGIVIPVLAYADLAAAVAWLCDTFGFRERMWIGTHRCQSLIGDAAMVATQLPAGSVEAPGASSTMVRVADVDAHYARALAHGATGMLAPESYPYGERQYSVTDIGGHRWTFTQSLGDVDPQSWGGRMVG